VTDALYLLGRGQAHGKRYVEIAGLSETADYDPEAVVDSLVARLSEDESPRLNG
jgi:hypothetical protein